MNLAVIGSGNIAQFHIVAMKEAGFNIVAISGLPNSRTLLNVAKKHGINKIYKNSIVLIKDVNKWDALLILSPISTVVNYLQLAAPYGKPILAEKPVAFNHIHLDSLIKYKNIRVAYNRRFYSGVAFSKKFIEKHPKSLIKVTIPENRKDPDHNFDFPSRLPVLSYENSVHIFDLINFISKGIKWGETSTIKTLDKYLAVIAHGRSSNGAIIQLDSYYNSPENFSISILSGDERVEMKPIEVTSLFKGMEVKEPTDEIPIRLYTPKLKKRIIDLSVNEHKPGFLRQAQDFMDFCQEKENCIGADIIDAYNALKIAQSLIRK